jgi:hypothetical protein
MCFDKLSMSGTRFKNPDPLVLSLSKDTCEKAA